MNNDENLNPNLSQIHNYDPLRVKKPSVKKEAAIKVSDKLRDSLPYELQLMFTFFLTSKDIVLLLSNISRYWRKFAKDQKLW